MDNNITYFGEANARNQRKRFGIKRRDRTKHMYIIGKTGMGKTTLLENMVISDINTGKGVAVVDPHGDFSEKILHFIPASRINDIVYVNPADIDYPIAFNVMEQVDPKYRHLIASGLIGVFKKIWADSWGPRLEYLLRNVILGLLEYQGSTLLGVPRMLVDKEYRKKVVSKISDPVVKAFWTTEFTKYSNQFTVDAISPIQNKVGQFLSSSLVRNIVSQTHSSIDMRDIMDNKKILIMNLAKGRIGEDYSALLGAMLVTKIQLAAMGRVDIKEEERKDFYLYVDEFQNFATESFANILSEARKYRLNLIIAHQYISQLDEKVRDAIFGNVGTIVAFRVGASDAEFLEKEFEPVFTMNDLVNLAKYDAYLKLMINGVAGDAFSATSLPPQQLPEKSSYEKIIKVSRERYTNKREEVEEKILRWSGVKDEEQLTEERTLPVRERNRRELKYGREDAGLRDEREMWGAVCEACGERIKVPFKPDPSRSTYCRNCLVEVRKQMTEAIKKDQYGFKARRGEGTEKRKTYLPERENEKIKSELQKELAEKNGKERQIEIASRKVLTENEPKIKTVGKEKLEETAREKKYVQEESEGKLKNKISKDISPKIDVVKTKSGAKRAERNNREIKEGEVVKFNGA